MQDTPTREPVDPRGAEVLGAAAALGALGISVSWIRGTLALGPAVEPQFLATSALWYVGLFLAAGVTLLLLSRLAPRFTRRMAVETLLVGTCLLVLAGAARAFALGWGLGLKPLVADLVALGFGAGCVWLGRRARVAVPRLPVTMGLTAVVVLATTAVTLSHRPDGPLPEAPDALATSHPSVLFVLVDTVRYDHTSLSGYDRPTTPNLAALAESGLVFDRARGAASWTKPSMASMLTGLPAGTTGAEERLAPLSSRVVTLAEAFRAAGYATGVFSDNPFVSSHFGLTQGYAHRVELPFRTRTSHLGLSDSTALSRAAAALLPNVEAWLVRGTGEANGTPFLHARFLEWLDRQPEGTPWFAHVHVMDAHDPYDPPDPWRQRMDPGSTGPEIHAPRPHGTAPFLPGAVLSPERRRNLIASYDGSIAYWDHLFGKLIRELESRGRLSDTLVVVTSDHGEGLGDHGVWDHRNSLYDELLHVPLVIRGPGVPAGRVPHDVSTEGLAETVLRAAGWVPPPAMAPSYDHHLIPVPEASRTIRSRLLPWDKGSQASIVADGRKWVISERDGRTVLQCFDLVADPGEVHDIAATLPRDADTVRATFARWDDALRALAVDSGAGDAGISDAAHDAIRSIGYVGDDE